ncbi:MAG: uroporphyrinogen decarboxylase family protein [Saccharofermentanales bacterium]
MNGFQRVTAALKGEWPDKRPIVLHNFMLAAKEAGFTMKQYYSNPENAAKAHIQAVEKYGLDGVLWDLDTAVLASAVGVPVDFPENEPARAHKACLNHLEEIENLNIPDISKNERIIVAVEGFKMLKKYFGNEIHLRGNADQAPFSLASMMRTPAEWMMDLIINPELCHKLLCYTTKVVKKFIQLLADEGAHLISNGDSPAGPEMISPEQYLEFALPYEKEIVEYTHDLGLPYMLHICGNTELILDEMPKTGLDAVELDYKTDINKIFSKYNQKITLSGNIDPSGVIANGTKELVKEKTLEILNIYKHSPRFIMNAGCAIPPTTPEGNIRILVNTTRSYM